MTELAQDVLPRRRARAATVRTAHVVHAATRCAYDGEAPPDAETVIARLEEAGRALLSLPNSGPSTALRLNAATIVRLALTRGVADPISPLDADASDLANQKQRAPAPSPACVTRMDEALGWIALIPQDRYVLRRVVGLRALVHPLTDRHTYAWRRIGKLLGADHKAIQRWHAQGIDTIVGALHARRRAG